LELRVEGVRAIVSGAHRIRVYGMGLTRLFSLIPLLVYGIGFLGILVGWFFGDWQLAFHPDRLLPFEVVGLATCSIVYWRS